MKGKQLFCFAFGFVSVASRDWLAFWDILESPTPFTKSFNKTIHSLICEIGVVFDVDWPIIHSCLSFTFNTFQEGCPANSLPRIETRKKNFNFAAIDPHIYNFQPIVIECLRKPLVFQVGRRRSWYAVPLFQPCPKTPQK